MKICLLLLATGALSLFSSCCDTAAYEAQLQTWVNRSETDLLSAWGAPSSTYDIDSRTKLVIYSKSRTQFIEGRSPSVTTVVDKKDKDRRVETTRYDDGSPDRIVTYYCTTTFTIKSKKVTAWKWEGDDCCG